MWNFNYLHYFITSIDVVYITGPVANLYYILFKRFETALSFVSLKLSIFSDFFIPYFLFPPIVHGSK